MTKGFTLCRLETKMLVALGHDANGELACYKANLESWGSLTLELQLLHNCDKLAKSGFHG